MYSVARVALVFGLGTVSSCAAPASDAKSPVPSPAPTNPAEQHVAPLEKPAPAVEAIWLADPEPDLRRLTVLVRVRPPRELADKYSALARRYKPLRSLFGAHAEEGFGSGFVMVRREEAGAQGAERRTFIVTNRHVVGLASRGTVTAEGVHEPFEARVAYVDESYDLAVLVPDASGANNPGSLPFNAGFAFASKPARDQDVVVASGYPGIGEMPSYQVTRGYVSNERFLFDDGRGEQLYVQHTAPIDPGSSGGPLTTHDGKLLGVNTLKAPNRENFGLAVPGSAVEHALAVVVRQPSHAGAPGTRSAQAACEDLLRDLYGGSTTLRRLARNIGVQMVAEHGVGSLDVLPREEEWVRRFVDEPTEVFLHAIAVRLQAAAQGEAGATSPPTCEPEAPVPSGASPTFRVRLGGADRRFTFVREQERWKVSNAGFAGPTDRSFLDRLDGPRKPRENWKPSLR